MKKRLAAEFLAAVGMRNTMARLLPREGVLILNYHRVGDGSLSPHDRELWSATEERFDAQIGFLKTHCDVIGLADLPDALHTRGGRHVAITFDDGYLDNYKIAYPVLRSHGVPAAFFIATDFIDRPTLPWWDEIAINIRTSEAASLDIRPWLDQPLTLDDGQRDAAIHTLLRIYKTLSPDEALGFLVRLRSEAASIERGVVGDHWMDWDMIRDMAANGMTIGGHTASHPVLATLPPSAQRREIADCALRLREELGIEMEYFAYPVGSRQAFDARTMHVLDELGVSFAFSYYGGIATRHSGRFDLPRVAVETHMSMHLFQAMVQLPQLFCRRRDE